MAIINTNLKDLPTGCGTCPDVILGLITDDVTEMLDKIRRAKRVVQAINRYTHYAADLLIEELERLYNLIPEPPMLNIQLVTGMLTCPLTPQALVIEQFDRSFAVAQKAAEGKTYFSPRITAFYTALSQELFSMTSVYSSLERPRDALVRILRIIEGFANRLKELVTEFMNDLSGIDNAGFVRLAYRLAQELRDTFRDVDQYLLKLAVTSGSVSLVKATCPLVYERDDMPFKAFDDEITSFSHDGIIPSGFDGETARIMRLFSQIQGKIARWQSASFLAVT